MTPIGHTAISYCIGKASKKNKLIIPAIIIGIIPDIDFLFIGFEWFNQYHRVITHNIFFIGVIAFLIQRRYKLNKSELIFLLFVGFGHLFTDSIMDSNPTNGIGVSYFYPFDMNSYSPFNLLSNYESNTSWEQPIEMLRKSFRLIIWEIPFIILGVILMKNKKKHKS